MITLVLSIFSRHGGERNGKSGSKNGNGTAAAPAATDAQLLAQYKAKGNVEVLGQLYQRYTHLVYGICMKYLKNSQDSEDAVMEIFEGLVEKLRKHEVENFGPWLHTTTRNHCLMQLRSSQSQQKKAQEYENELAFMESNGLLHLSIEAEGTLDPEAANQLASQKLALAMARLPGEQQQCLKLFYLENKSYKEVATLTGLDLKKVKSHIQNGKRNLRNYLSSHE